jgi:hypothetical protein
MFSPDWLRQVGSGHTIPRPLVYHHHRRKTHLQTRALSRTYDYARGAYFAECIANAVLRRTSLPHWFKWISRGSLGRTYRELSGGLRFLLQQGRDTNSD